VDTVNGDPVGPGKESAKRDTAAEKRYPYTKEAGIEREGKGETHGAGYWDDMRPQDSSDLAQNRSRSGVFEKDGGSGPTVIKPGSDFGKGKDPRSLNHSGVYAEKDAKTWTDMAGAAKVDWERPRSRGEESEPGGMQGQYWRGEPWSRNPDFGGRETTRKEGKGPGRQDES
jgi:hypothetical protein